MTTTPPTAPPTFEEIVALPIEPPIVWNKEQQAAIDRIAAWAKTEGGGCLSLTGPAGSGKTTLVRALKDILKRATWAAMTGKAALRVFQATGVAAKTLHSILYKPPEESGGDLIFEEVLPPPSFIVVIDEASMMPPSVYIDLQEWVKRGVKILLIGDAFQVPPIMTKLEEQHHGKFFTVFSLVDGPALTTVMRSDSDIVNAATKIRQTGIIPRVSSAKYIVKVVPDPVIEACNSYLADPDDHVLITWRNDVRMRANNLIRTMRGLDGRDLSAGEIICVRQNGQGALNGEIYTVKEVIPGGWLGPIATMLVTTTDDKRLQVVTSGNDAYMDGGMPRLGGREWQQFKAACKMIKPLPVTYGYALSGHMSQGSEFRRVTVMLSKADFDNPAFCAMTLLPKGGKAMMAARWAYTAVTRAKQHVTVLLDR